MVWPVDVLGAVKVARALQMELVNAQAPLKVMVSPDLVH